MKIKIIIILSISAIVFSQSQNEENLRNSKTVIDSLSLNETNYSTDGGIALKVLCNDSIFYEVELWGESYNSKAIIMQNGPIYTLRETVVKYNVPYYDTKNFDIKKAKIQTNDFTFDSKPTNEYSFYLEIIDLVNKKSSTKQILDGSYGLSHKFLKNDSLNIIPTPEDNIIVSEDSIFYYGFEPYSQKRKGKIEGNYFIFENGSISKFKVHKKGFYTYCDSLVYEWYNHE